MLLTPIVIGPAGMLVVTDPEEARRYPELSVLSVLTHGADDNSSGLFEALLAGLEKIDLEHAKLYTDLIVTSLPAAAKRRLEEIMTIAQEQGNEFAGAYLPKTFAKGHAAGRAEGKADAILAVLAARSVDVSDGARDRIGACTDDEQLDAWIHRAVLANNVDDLFV